MNNAIEIKKDWEGELLGTKRKHFQVVNNQHSNIQASKFGPLSVMDVLSMPPQEFIVHGLLPKTGLAVWFGAPGSAKTFLAIDLAMSCASGYANWFGREIKPLTVVYVAGEGLGGLSNRLRAWVDSNCNPDSEITADIHFVAHPPNLFEGEAEKFVTAISALKPNLIIIDTLARSSVGADENSARDMGKVVSGCDALIQRLNCCVLLIHHAGRAGWERGSTALRGASDVMLEVKKHDDGTRELVLNGQSAKIKEGAESESIFFKLTPVGDSCIVEPADAVQTRCKRPLPKGGKQRLVYELAGQALKDKSRQVDGRPSITFAELHVRWLGAVSDKRDREPNSLRRVLRTMIDRGVFGGDESAIWCP